MSHSPAVSVIVPVYKAEKYIHKCVDSLLSQTFQDYEILLIDDGSPDRSGDICDEYAQRDKRVRVLHKENGGVSRARNLGLDNANGQWIVFVDSDDWVEKNYLQKLLEPTQNEYVELVVSGIQYFFAHNNRYRTMFTYPDLFIDLDKMPEIVSSLQLLNNGCPVAKLYQAKIIRSNHLHFNTDLSINEDHLFVIQYYNAISKMFTIQSVSYNYFFDFKIPSLTKTFHSSEEFIKIAEMMSDEFKIFINRYNNLSSELFFSSVQLFGLQQIIKAIDNSVYSESPYAVLVKARELFLQGCIAKPDKKGLHKLRFYFLMNQNYKLLTVLVCLQMKIRNLISAVKFKIKQIMIF